MALVLSAAKKPRRPANRTRNAAMTLKTSKEIRDRLEMLREKSCRSLTQEVEHQILKAFDLEEQLALQDEIKAEMRGTIAALEQRIAFMEERERMLWPDDSSRALGKAFSRALAAVQYATGKSWREDATAAPIVASVTRRLMAENSRTGGSLFAELFDRERIDFLTAGIVKTIGGDLQKDMPPLPPLQPQDDPANWTNRARSAVTFRDKATGELLQVVAGPEFDIADPEAERGLGPKFDAAVDRFRPIRDRIEAEDFIVYPLKDGSTSWESLGRVDRKIHVPAGQDAPPALRPQPAQPHQAPIRAREPDHLPDGLHYATDEELADLQTPPGLLPPEIGDRALFDEVTAGLPMVQTERAAEAKRRQKAPLDVGTAPVEATTPKRRGRPRKTPAEA